MIAKHNELNLKNNNNEKIEEIVTFMLRMVKLQ